MATDDTGRNVYLVPTLFKVTPVPDDHDFHGPLILKSPFISSLLFTNSGSTARDNCASERNFLSWLRLAVFLDVLGVAVMLSFHFKQEPTEMERKMAFPLGLVFWVLSFASLLAAAAQYFTNIIGYARQTANVTAGKWVRWVLGFVVAAVFGTCILLLVVHATK